MYQNPEIKSSYYDGDLGRTLYNEVIKLKPDKVIDFGVLDGYSTVCIAQALRDNKKGKVKAYDIFEKYEYNHSSVEKLVKNIEKYGLLDYVEIDEVNFFDWIKNPEDFDALHLDISNTGDIIDMLAPLQGRGLVMFEGGSEQRDRVGWVFKYNKKPIGQSKLKFEIINKAFPSISKLI